MQMRIGVRKIDENSWDFVSMRIHQKGGHEQMCDLVENYARECVAEAVEKTTKQVTEQVTEQMTRKATVDMENNARRLFQNGGSYELVRDSIPSLSAERLQEIYDEVRNRNC